MSGSPPLRQRVRQVLPFAVSAGVLVWLLARFDLRAVVSAVEPKAALLLAAALAVYGVVSLALEAIALTRLLAGSGLTPGVAARIKAASYLLAAVHFTVGLGALSVLVRRRTGLDLGRSAGAVLLLSALDLGVLVALSALGSWLLETRVPAVPAWLLAGTAGAGLLGLALLRLPVELPGLAALRGWSVLHDLATLPLPRLAELACWRVLFCSSFVLVVGAALVAFGIVVPPGDLVVGVLVASLVTSLPIAVSGLGTGQAVFLYVFRAHGSPETLLACSLALSVGLIGMRALMGLLFAREYAREAAELARAGEATS